MSSKSKKSSKPEKSEKKEKKHHSAKTGAKIVECAKNIISLAAKKPKHYTSRYLASEAKLGGKYGSEIVRAALAKLEADNVITFTRKDGGKNKKGQFVIVPLTKKAA